MNIKQIITISVCLVLVSSDIVQKTKPKVFEGSLSQTVYQNKTKKVLTGNMFINEKEFKLILADTASIQVNLKTEDKVKLVSEKKMKDLIESIRNELTVKTKMVF